MLVKGATGKQNSITYTLFKSQSQLKWISILSNSQYCWEWFSLHYVVHMRKIFSTLNRKCCHFDKMLSLVILRVVIILGPPGLTTRRRFLLITEFHPSNLVSCCSEGRGSVSGRPSITAISQSRVVAGRALVPVPYGRNHRTSYINFIYLTQFITPCHKPQICRHTASDRHATLDTVCRPAQVIRNEPHSYGWVHMDFDM